MTDRQRNLPFAISVMMLFVALALLMSVLALNASTAGASPMTDGKDGQKATDTGASNTGTGQSDSTDPQHHRAPIRLRPWVQFGRANPGTDKIYHQILWNRLMTDTLVDLFGGSVQGWNVTVAPDQVNAEPGVPVVITTSVSVPTSPTHRLDIERVRATMYDPVTYTTTAYMITIVRRQPFTDVDENHWADGPIQYLVDQGVAGGYADGSFRPDQNVTRAQFAKMLVGAMGWPLVTPPTPTFSDVPAGYWAYSYIETAAAHGVIGGYSDGSFRPDAGITRAQVAKMLYLARGWQMDPPQQGSFSDVSAGDWFYVYAEAASSAEVMSGYADHTFRPNLPTTRAQAAKILVLGLFSQPDN